MWLFICQEIFHILLERNDFWHEYALNLTNVQMYQSQKWQRASENAICACDRIYTTRLATNIIQGFEIRLVLICVHLSSSHWPNRMSVRIEILNLHTQIITAANKWPKICVNLVKQLNCIDWYRCWHACVQRPVGEWEKERNAAGWSNICFKDVLQAAEQTNQASVFWWYDVVLCLHMSCRCCFVKRVSFPFWEKFYRKCSEAENHRERKRNVWVPEFTMGISLSLCLSECVYFVRENKAVCIHSLYNCRSSECQCWMCSMSSIFICVFDEGFVFN